MTPLRVLVVDDHVAIRRAVRNLLQSETAVQVIAEARNGEEAVETADKMRPDLIIMDVSMPVRNGFSAATEIKTSHPETKILMFSGHNLQALVREAKDRGLNGYVSKEEDGQGLLKAVDAVIHDHTYFPPPESK